jgi:hypothetical protein
MVPLSHGTAPAPKSGAGEEVTLQVLAPATTAETVTVPPAAATFAGFAVKAEMTGGGEPAVCAAVVGADMAAAPLDAATAPVPAAARTAGIAK